MIAKFNWIISIIALIHVTVSSAGYAQTISADRFEIPVALGEAPYSSIGLEKNGIVTYRHIEGKQENFIELIKLDTSLNENWRGHINIKSSLDIIRAKYHGEKLFLLLKDIDHRIGGFVLITVSLNGTYEIDAIDNLIPFKPTEFEITDYAALLGGYINGRPLVLYFRFENKRANILPGFFNEPGELDQLKVYPDGTSDVVIRALDFEKKKSLYVKNYNAQGQLVKNVLIQPKEDKGLLFGRSIKLTNGTQIVCGVYGETTDYSQGVFVTEVSDQGQYSLRYYNFGDLKNFFSYMEAKKQGRIKDKIERKTIRDKKVKFNYRFLIDDIIHYQDQFIMTGEAFYAKYKSPGGGYAFVAAYPPVPVNSAQIMSGPNLSSARGRNLEFEGYQYSHAVVIGFDEKGKIRWDNSFEINDVITKDLERLVHIHPEKDKIYLSYMFKNSVRSKVIDGSEVLEGNNEAQINPSSAAEKIDLKSIKGEQFEPWYDKYLYASGTESIKRENERRISVFFIKKVLYK